MLVRRVFSQITRYILIVLNISVRLVWVILVIAVIAGIIVVIGAQVIGLLWLLAIVVIIITAMLLIPFINSRKMLAEWAGMIRRGEYDALLPIVEKTVPNSVDWDIKILGITSYIQVGKLDDAEQLIRATLTDLLQANIRIQLERIQESKRILFRLLSEIYIADARFDDAQVPAQHALELGKRNVAIEYTLAKLCLYKGQADKASIHLDTALNNLNFQGKQPTGYHLALRAWALALKGDRQQANASFQDALNRTSVANVANLSEIYLLGGYVARAENESLVEQQSFQKAIDLNPRGIYALIARRELNSKVT